MLILKGEKKYLDKLPNYSKLLLEYLCVENQIKTEEMQILKISSISRKLETEIM